MSGGCSRRIEIEQCAHRSRACYLLMKLENIDDVNLPLFDAAKEFGGEYEGWEAQVID